MSITVTKKVHFSTGLAGQKRLRKGPAAKSPTTRVPRISRLMALAIHFDQLIRDGKVTDYAELARLGNVTRARVTQIMNLLTLAPDIQEALLFLEPTIRRGDAVKERDLQQVVGEADWRKQRARIRSNSGAGTTGLCVATAAANEAWARRVATAMKCALAPNGITQGRDLAYERQWCSR